MGRREANSIFDICNGGLASTPEAGNSLRLVGHNGNKFWSTRVIVCTIRLKVKF